MMAARRKARGATSARRSRSRVGYAVVGLGHIAQRAILPAFRHARRSKLVALVSSDIGKAERLALQFGAGTFYSNAAFEQCLQNPAVDAVYIATANGAHVQFALQAAAHGKHVICEKPLATTVADCQAMVGACQKNRVYLMTAYRKYLEPASVELKKVLTTGKLGALRTIHTAFTNNLPPSADSWHLDAGLAGGGALMDLGIYCVNSVRWLTEQEPLEATAYSWTTVPNRFATVEENIAFQLKFPPGLYVQGSTSFTAMRASFLQVHGEEGWAALDPAFAYNEERRLFGKIESKWFEKRYKVMDEFRLELDYFAECIFKNRAPEPDGVTGLKDLAVIEAIYRAAKLGHPVAIQPAQ
jgi:predicted dehydrogenase